MIKDIKYRVTIDGRGKISSGKKSEKGFPQSLPYFDVSDFRELEKTYGMAPAKLLVYFPSDNIPDFFDCNYVAWAKKEGDPVKRRQCDGERCIHRIDEQIMGKQYAAGEESECICQTLHLDEKSACRYEAYLRAWVGDPQTGKIENTSCYLFNTHSKNSGDAIYSELEKIKSLNGTLRGVPFVLSVKMVSGKLTARQKFPIWQLQVLGTLSKLQQLKGKTFQIFDRPLDLKDDQKQIGDQSQAKQE